MARTLITAPPTARRGDVIEVRTLIAHPMETGFRLDADGRGVPRDIVRRLSCDYDGATVFSAELFPAIAVNPFIAFCLRVTASGPVTLRWEGDNGFAQTETVMLAVT